MKVLYIDYYLSASQSVRQEAANSQPNRTWFTAIRRWGYELVTIPAEGFMGLSFIDPDEYAFQIVPYFESVGGGATRSYYAQFSLGIPILAATNSASSNVRAFTGMSAKTDSGFKEGDFTGNPSAATIPLNCKGWTVNPAGTGVVTPIATDVTDSTKVLLWKHVIDGQTAPAYFYGDVGADDCLPLLLQMAINDGVVTDLPTNKLPIMIDIDDAPDTTLTLSDLNAIYNIQLAYGMPITWGLKTGIDTQPLTSLMWADIPAYAKTFLSTKTPNLGGLLYTCSHNHNWRWDKSDAPVNTKEAMDTEYRGDTARPIADGIAMGWDVGGLDSWGYTYPPENKVSNEMMELGSPQEVKASSPLNDTVQVGYNWSVVRLDAGSAPGGFGQISYMDAVHYHRGLYFIGTCQTIDSSFLKFTDAADSLNQRRKGLGLLFNSMMPFGTAMYFHGGNFYDGHDGGEAPGLELLEMLGAWGKYCSDVATFMHPTAYAATLAAGYEPSISLCSSRMTARRLTAVRL